MSNLLSKINDIQSVCEAVIKKMAKYVEAADVNVENTIGYLAGRIGTIRGLSDAARADAARLINSDEPTEYFKWLEYFHENADFGPADGDVRSLMFEEFKEDTGSDLEEEDI